MLYIIPVIGHCISIGGTPASPKRLSARSWNFHAGSPFPWRDFPRSRCRRRRLFALLLIGAKLKWGPSCDVPRSSISRSFAPVNLNSCRTILEFPSDYGVQVSLEGIPWKRPARKQPKLAGAHEPLPMLLVDGHNCHDVFHACKRLAVPVHKSVPRRKLRGEPNRCRDA